MFSRAAAGLASSPGSCGGEEEKKPGTQCSRMRQVPLVLTCNAAYYSATLKLRSIPAYLLKAALHSYTPCGTHTSDFEVKNNIALTVTVCIASFEVIGEFQRERLRHHVPKRLAGMDERVDNSCKGIAKYLRRSLVIIHTQCSRGRQLLYEAIEAKIFTTFCKNRGNKIEVLHPLAPALTLTFNHLANELLQATTMLYGLMCLTYGSATEHEYLITRMRDGL